ncbi:MAG: LPXTG cell wall anchor domain-containing protein [Anaerolineae bacterium]
MSRKFNVLAGLIVALLLIAAPVVQAQMTPSVEVSDQEIVNDTVTVDKVVSDGPGWIVIHADDNGSPGTVIGHSAVQDGENLDVSVPISTTQATETLYAMLHTDAGQQGTYEFPGADAPVSVNGQVVVQSFTVTGGLAQSQGQATPQPTTQPGTLPVTGGSNTPWLPIAFIAAGLLIVAVAWLLMRRDTEKVHVDR